MTELRKLLFAPLEGRTQHLLSDMLTQAAIGFELCFVEELIGGRFMGKAGWRAA